MEQTLEPFIMEYNDREFQSQSFYVDNNLRVENAIDSFLYLPGFQSSFGIENNMLDFNSEDIDDPDYLSEVELIEIEASLKDYSEGKFKRGSIDELLKDLKD
ncbi:hypothetical protein [Acidiplasma sp.]|uniref:hypothetical protein n=1 Tax=Acidiplasma sp. TaxID=1872114 RepID=UPI0031623DC0